MKLSSDILLHFVHRAGANDPVAQVGVCEAILATGFRFTEQSTILHTAISATAGRISCKAVCFTDIPLRMSEAHAHRYGRCAIGVRKARVKQWGGNPVLYVVDRRGEMPIADVERKDLRGVFAEYLVGRILNPIASPHLTAPDHWIRRLEPAEFEKLKGDVAYLFAYVKEMFDLGSDVDHEDEPRRDRYFLEREWRVGFTDVHVALARKTAPESDLVRTDPAGHPYLRLEREDVRVVILPNEWARKELAKRLINGHGWRPEELPTLITYEASKDL